MNSFQNMFYNQFRMIIVQQFGNFSSQTSDGDSTEKHTDDDTPVKQDLHSKNSNKSFGFVRVKPSAS